MLSTSGLEKDDRRKYHVIIREYFLNKVLNSNIVGGILRYK